MNKSMIIKMLCILENSYALLSKSDILFQSIDVNIVDDESKQNTISTLM